MHAFPPELFDSSGRQLTGLVCPDCAGSLTAEQAGRKGHLHFECRIGHGFSLPALLAAKEQVIEERLWSAVYAVEEMVALLSDLEAHSARQCWPGSEEPCRQRRQALEADARVLRELIEQDRPVDLGFGELASDDEAAGTVP